MPIIKSLLDVDFYKLTMMQVIHKHHPDVEAGLELKNRSSKTDLLSAVVDIELLREELQITRGLRFKRKEIDFLRHCPGYPPGLFSEEFLGFLAGFQLPPIETCIRDGEIGVTSKEKWLRATLWETLSLSIANELYYDALRLRDGTQQTIDDAACNHLYNRFWDDGRDKLREKIARIKRMPSVRIIEFGTRRRHSAQWQEQVVEELVKGLPGQLLGTSNVRLAMKYGIQPIGTFAHEMFMGYAAIAQSHGQNIVKSHGQMLEDWRAMYGNQLSVALTDTFGSGFFFRDMSEEAADAWQWLRHDSGDPCAFGERAIDFYKSYGIDPRRKGIVFSDGLTVDVIERLVERFEGRIKLAFGWGTDLTNDLGYRPLSLVMKVVEARGYDTVKLSDNPAKATGRPDIVDLYKHLFQYEEGERVECTF